MHPHWPALAVHDDSLVYNSALAQHPRAGLTSVEATTKTRPLALASRLDSTQEITACGMPAVQAWQCHCHWHCVAVPGPRVKHECIIDINRDATRVLYQNYFLFILRVELFVLLKCGGGKGGDGYYYYYVHMRAISLYYKLYLSSCAVP